LERYIKNEIIILNLSIFFLFLHRQVPHLESLVQALLVKMVDTLWGKPEANVIKLVSFFADEEAK
jgi:hypothetical protein